MSISSLSVVIPTLGGESLNTVIKKLNDGDDIPGEILVCIPINYKKNLNIENHSNIKIIDTQIGQVQQRIDGFKNAKFPYVLQLDDDCKISNTDLKNLLLQLKKLGQGNVIAPIYYDEKTNKCSHPYVTGIRGFVKNLIATLVCGAPWD